MSSVTPKIVDLTEEVSDSESTASTAAPPFKKQKLNNGNHNHNHHNHNGRYDSDDARNHVHYIKFEDRAKELSSKYLAHNTVDEDIIITDPNEKDKQMMRLKAQNKSLIAQNKRLQAQAKAVRKKFGLLRNIATGNNEPSYTCVPMNKKSGIASIGIAQIKKKLVFRRLRISIKDTAHKQYTTAIKTFVKRNHSINPNTGPKIAVSEREKSHFENQKDLLKVWEKNERDNNGEFVDSVDENMQNTSLIATHNIMASTVIGEYYGLEITISEFDKIYHLSKKELANLYAFNMAIDVSDIAGIDSEDESEENSENDSEELKTDKAAMETAIKDIEINKNKFVIDAIGYQTLKMHDEHLLMYVKPVSEAEMNKANVVFVTAEVSGWPHIFVVTKKRIKRGRAVCAYFGREFGLAMYEKLEEERRRERLLKKIDSLQKMDLLLG